MKKCECICQCGSCEKTFKHNKVKEAFCPYCGSGNWVFGLIDEPEPPKHEWEA